MLERYPTLREPLAGYMRSALTEDRETLINEELGAERARLGLSDVQIAEAADSVTAPSGPVAEYFNRQDQLYLQALLSEQFQALQRYAPAIINALYRATATTLLGL